MDQVQVRDHGRRKHVIVEGNRRIATLEHLQRRYQDSSIDLGNLPQRIFDAVPVAVYDADDEARHKVVAGLGHIAGKSDGRRSTK